MPPRRPIVLRQAGKTLISKVGGASGPLYGTAFLRGAGALGGGEHASAGRGVRRGARGSHRRDRRARQGGRGRGDDARCAVPGAASRPGRARRRRRPRRGDGRGSRRCRGRRRRDDPDAGHEGPRVVPRRAQHRPPGSRRDLGGAAAGGPRRDGRGRPAIPPTPPPRPPDDQMARATLIGRPGSPGVGRRPLALGRDRRRRGAPARRRATRGAAARRRGRARPARRRPSRRRRRT